MPTYEYRCAACGHQFELFQSMSAPDPEVCEQCGEKAVEKVLFAPAIHYKGSGFYATDYAGKKSSPTSSGTSGGEASSTSGSDSASGGTSSGSGGDSGSSSSSSSSD
ncbi:MAG: zinc ribbon domain-containing protein [Thermoleophilia bacterium]|nr:zinc ribbon domain-containing protein [Thermoleophilia bacterium]